MPGSTLYSLLLGTAVKSTVVLAAAFLAAVFLRRRSAAVRHLVWSAAFAALLALPLLSISLPALRLPLTSSLLGPGFAFGTDSSSRPPQVVTPPANPQAPAAFQPENAFWHRNWADWLMLFWAAGTAVSFAQMLIGFTVIWRLRRSARPVSTFDLNSVTRLLGIEEEVDVLEGPCGSMPITYGLFRPVILLPAEIVSSNVERTRLVLLHELAHVRRGDGATHLLARTAFSLYWWNPLARIAWREFLKEREQAADDLVLRAGASASRYAEHLLDVARSMLSPASAGYAAVPMARRSQLEGRLLAIVDANRDRRTLRRPSHLIAALLVIAVVAPLAALEGRQNAVNSSPADALNANSFLGTIQNGDLALDQNRVNDAQLFYEKALAMAGNPTESAMALLRSGTAALAMKNAPEAIGDFEQAQKADSSKTAEAEMWMAIAQEHQNDVATAERYYQSALAAAPPDSEDAATTMELYARLLTNEGRQDEARAMQARAAAIRKDHANRVLSEPSGSDVYRIAGDVRSPVLVYKIEPDYTQRARIAKYSGSALLAVEIDTDGTVRNIRVARALGFGLDEKAIQAVRRWRFKPSVKNGQQVKVTAQIEVNFRLL